MLQVSAVTASSERDLDQLISTAVFGGLRRSPYWTQVETPTATISSPDGELRAGIDGELKTLGSPLAVRVDHGALRLLVPRGTPVRKDPNPGLLSHEMRRRVWRFIFGDRGTGSGR